MWLTNNALIQDAETEPGVLTSSPYEWPLLLSGIRMTSFEDHVTKFYMLGNPLVWWMGAMSVLILSLFLLAVAILDHRNNPSKLTPGTIHRTDAYFAAMPTYEDALVVRIPYPLVSTPFCDSGSGAVQSWPSWMVPAVCSIFHNGQGAVLAPLLSGSIFRNNMHRNSDRCGVTSGAVQKRTSDWSVSRRCMDILQVFACMLWPGGLG